MVKLSILMVRRADLTYAQFLKHWREVHGPLFAAQPEAATYVRGYIQDHKLPETAVTEPFDGIAETWFDDMEAAETFFASDGYKNDVIPDEQAFMSLKQCKRLWSTEISVISMSNKSFLLNVFWC